MILLDAFIRFFPDLFELKCRILFCHQLIFLVIFFFASILLLRFKRLKRLYFEDDLVSLLLHLILYVT